MSKDFLSKGNKKITLLGMSGVGKTHISKMLNSDGNWYHYSGDYRIGSKYLKQPIIQNIKDRMKNDAWLSNLIDREIISIDTKITYDNLNSISVFLGKVGNPDQGGLSLKDFNIRQEMHRLAESKSMMDVGEFITKSNSEGFDHFINDAGGSLCELDDDEIYQYLANQTLIVYIRASDENIIDLEQRAKSDPKPLYFQSEFLINAVGEYLNENGMTYVAEICPNDFISWVFPRLLQHRIPKMERIAEKYGCIIESKDLYQCKQQSEVLELINSSLN